MYDDPYLVDRILDSGPAVLGATRIDLLCKAYGRLVDWAESCATQHKNAIAVVSQCAEALRAAAEARDLVRAQICRKAVELQKE